MTGRVEGKVAFITGVARGQGRAHAIRLAEEGADVIGVDICDRVASVPYPLATQEDLEQTAAAVRALGRRIFTAKADVRDFDSLRRALDEGVATLGRLDVVSANAGIFSVGGAVDLSEAAWRDMIDLNLTGAWHTAKAAIPHLLAGGRGGSIVLTSSKNGQVGAPMFSHYVAAKHGVIGLMRGLSIELAQDRIRVNALMPGGVATQMVRDFVDIQQKSVRYVAPDPADSAPGEAFLQRLLDPRDLSDALLFLASDDSRSITGTVLQVDGMELANATRAAAKDAEQACAGQGTR